MAQKRKESLPCLLGQQIRNRIRLAILESFLCFVHIFQHDGLFKAQRIPIPEIAEQIAYILLIGDEHQPIHDFFVSSSPDTCLSPCPSHVCF